MQTTNDVKPRPHGAAYLFYLGLIGLLMVIIGLGYLGFRQFAGVIMPQMETYNLYLLAFIAGIASFFSPCAFPLLPSYLSFFSTQEAGSAQSERPTHYRTRILLLGVVTAGGIITFNLILGVLIGWLGTGLGTTLSMTNPELDPFVLWLRGVVGVLLIILGSMQWTGYNLKPGFADKFAWFTRPKRDGAGSSVWSLYLYGFGYNAAGLGCTAPILAGLMVFALTSGGFSAALTAFIIFSATMGGLMLIISILVAQSHDTFIRRLKANTNTVKRLSSILLIGVGLFSLFTVFNRSTFMIWFFPGADTNTMAAAGISMDFTPPVSGIYEGDEVLFIHTEASDLEVANLLTEMMGPQVVFMPRLGEAPEALLSEVYVFTNGISGSGPFGFQPDVFDSVPGNDDYSPLRAVNLVSWSAEAKPRLLGSLAEIKEADKAGEITVVRPGIVVNMPILIWPGGQR